MFSPVSQISIPSFPFFSLSPPFISSFTPFHQFGVFNPTILFQLNLRLSMDSAAFIISLISLSSSITSSSISLHFFFLHQLGGNALTSLPSDVFDGLSSLKSLFIPSHFLFSISLSFIPLSLYILITTVFHLFPLPSSLVSLPSLTFIPFPSH